MAAAGVGLKVNFFIPSHRRVAVKDQQMRAVSPELVGVARGLLQAGSHRGGFAFVLDFELQHQLLHWPQVACRRKRPLQKQVGAAPAQPVFAGDATAAVDDALQKGLQQQLRAGFVIGSRPCKTPNPMKLLNKL